MIAVLMAVHNGAAFLKAQLDSLAQQSESHFHLFIYDDHSQDASLDIIKQHQLYKRITLLPAQKQRLGAQRAFAHLMQYVLEQTDLPYFALCDQDDVWHRHRLKKGLEIIQHIDQPCLVHSDLVICNQNMQNIHPSMQAYAGLQHQRLQDLLYKNTVTGCTVLGNRALLELALPLPEQALMHDWWLALCAAAAGHLIYIDQTLVAYRQHDHNQIGAKRWGQWRHKLQHSLKQAQQLQQRLQQHGYDNVLVNRYADLACLSLWQRSALAHQRLLFKTFFLIQSLWLSCEH